MRDQRKYDAVVFDLYGTLIDAPVGQEEARVEMASVLGVEPGDFEDAWARFRAERDTGQMGPIEAIQAAMGVLNSVAAPDRIEAARVIRHRSMREGLEPRPGATEVLRTLRAKGYALGLLSNCSAEVPELWAETPFGSLFDATVFSASEGLMKPDRRLYLRASERLGVAPELCLYFGDGGDDELDAAAEVGMTPWLLLLPHEDPPAYESHAASADRWRHRHLRALHEALDVLEA